MSGWVEFKAGVRFNLRPPALRALAAAAEIFAARGLPLVVTSANDGVHMEGSLHYAGLAFDCRSKHLPDQSAKLAVLAELEAALGPSFDVLLEEIGDPNEHFHIEIVG